MKINVKKGNLFELNKARYLFAHCISSDCEMGAGIAVQFQKEFKLKQCLLEYPEEARKYPNCIMENNVFNLITKSRYWHKPTYESLEASLVAMRDIILENELEGIRVAMPKIGCGLDRLQWVKVKEIIEKVFDEVNIEIEVRHL